MQKSQVYGQPRLDSKEIVVVGPLKRRKNKEAISISGKRSCTEGTVFKGELLRMDFGGK
jgi:hypothetical protein